MSSVVLGVPVEDLTMASTVDLIDELIRDGRTSGRTHQVATVNVDFIVNALQDPELMEILRSTSVNMADGMPLLWASAAMGTPLTERVAGSDLFAALGRESERRGWDVHVFGGAPDVADRARQLIASDHPGAKLTIDPGPILPDVDEVPDAVIEGIVERDPDLLCVALGNPKQEHFIHNYRERLGCPVMIGVGGSMDMLVGDRKRASRRVQAAGLEWVARALQEPVRLGPRYARDAFLFAPKVARELCDAATSRHGWSLEVSATPDFISAVPSRVHRRDAPERRLTSAAMAALAPRPSVSIDLAGIDRLAWDGVAVLCQLLRHAQRYELDVTTMGLSEELRTSFADHAIGDWLASVLTSSSRAQIWVAQEFPNTRPTTKVDPTKRTGMIATNLRLDSIPTDSVCGP